MNSPENSLKTLKKSIKQIPDKLSEKQELYNLTRFTAILAIAAIALFYLSSLNLKMEFTRRQVAIQTTGVLQLTGINSSFYPHSAMIPKNSEALPEARQKFLNLGFREIPRENTTQFLSGPLHPQKQEVYNSYVQNLKEQGNRIYTSPAMITIQNPRKGIKPFQVNLVPECVGWIGMFAVIALIIAYPDADKKERFLGIILSIPLIHLMNIVRLSTTIYAGWSMGKQTLHLVHDVLWKTILIIWALILWIIWIKYIVEK